MRKTKIILRILSYSDLYNEIELINYSYEQLYDILRSYIFRDLMDKNINVQFEKI